MRRGITIMSGFPLTLLRASSNLINVNGSPPAMVLNLLETADIDAEELAELRKLIRRKAKEHKP